MDDIIENLATQHQLSREAVQTLWLALQKGNLKAAQFSHPELGGMGQWMPSMIMIGDMNNHALKAKIDAVCSTLTQHPPAPTMPAAQWWSSEFGTPSMSASQNDYTYAYFPSQNRLLIKTEKRVTVYDTSGYQITGVSAQNQRLQIQTNRGDKQLDDFPIVT